MTDAANYQRVLAATWEYLARVPEDGPPTRVSGAYWDIGQEMGVGLRVRGTRQDDLNAERFYAQIRRALDALAAEGKLVKIGKGDRNIRGYIQTTPEYYTPAQHEHAVAREQAKRSEASTTASRWETIFDTLADFDLTPDSKRGEPVQLSLDAWERIAPTLSDLVRR